MPSQDHDQSSSGGGEAVGGQVEAVGGEVEACDKAVKWRWSSGGGRVEVVEWRRSSGGGRVESTRSPGTRSASILFWGVNMMVLHPCH